MRPRGDYSSRTRRATLQRAVKYLKTHAAAGSPAAATGQAQLEELAKLLAAGFVVNRCVEGTGDDVLVLLTSASGTRGGRMGLVVHVEAQGAATHSRSADAPEPAQVRTAAVDRVR